MLKSLYGSRYADIEYEAVAWFGLGNISGQGGTVVSAWNALSDEKKIALQEAFKKVNNDCNGDTCK